ncbi:hypothetical protein Pfo_003768 [Paulownia fortunei]|nr:hypothetical protein Pfo_003768 [Paulownia fortunei]
MKRPHLFLLALVLLVHTIVMFAIAQLVTNITTDQSVLLTLKSHITNLDPSHILSKNWSDSTFVCNWIGVTCGSRHQRVTALDISMMGLIGNLRPELGNLSFLVSLNLSRNFFHGNVPQDFTRLRRLRFMDLSFNSLSGDIPSWFGFLPGLQLLYLRNNSFTGFILPGLSNMSKLEALDLSYNAIEGKIPQEIGDLLNLKEFRLRYNRLTGPIPFALFNISNIERFDLTGNSLYGNLPDSICHGTLPTLEGLYLSANEFYGEIPANLSKCSKLQVLSLSYNRFSGSIPREIGNLRQLQILYLGANNFTGEIPEELGNITTLKELDMPGNHFTGSITAKTFNISSLQYINIARSNLSGVLPADMCSNMKQLEEVYLNENNIAGVIPQEVGNLYNLEEFLLAGNNCSGSIPTSLWNVSTLRILSLSDNQLTGNLPPDLGDGLPNLEVLHLYGNNLSVSQELSFITSLMYCRNLRELSISENPLNSILPASIGNLSALQSFYAYNCGLRGSIPDEIGNISNLIALSLFGNHLTGSFPKTLANLQSLQGLFLYRNKINGTIPSTICSLKNLNKLVLSDNEIYGAIPVGIGNITTLRTLSLDSNKLDSTIPLSLWHLTNLLELNLSSNSLVGSLSLEIGNLRAADLIDLSMNQLSGIIPATIGDLQVLRSLSLAHNGLEGSIPYSIAEMVNLEILDLSQNMLSGSIPESLEKLLHLTDFNVSFNSLSGEIPSGGPFQNFTRESFMFNKGLCGDARYQVPPCHKMAAARPKRKTKLRVIFICLGISALLVIMMLAYGFARHGRKKRAPNVSDLGPDVAQMRVSYYELLEATDRYSESSLLGTGSFGSVYRGTLRNGKVVAVKVFHSQSEVAFKSFEVECQVLRNIRHRNLCKVIASCSNEDFKALILEYMPNGSLEKWLYSDDFFLDIIQRISIMIDVASALEYLHHGYSTPVVHCDLKPSNVLLDELMVAHLCDFGVSKLLGAGENSIQTMTLATFGYIAPEFGLDGRVSMRCDVYSYGIMLMEVFTRMKPNGETFAKDLSLRRWVMDSMPDAIVHIIDSNLLKPDDEFLSIKLDCLHSVMELALNCSLESPHERISIKDVKASLTKIKDKLLAY